MMNPRWGLYLLGNPRLVNKIGAFGGTSSV